MIFGYKRWCEQRYLLDRMTLGDLVKAYFTYPAIQVYLVLAAASIAAVLYLADNPAMVALAVGASLLVYPLVWYVLHRYVLHGSWLYRSPLTAALWKRIHFDHHQNPHDMSVLFGGLHTTLPTVFIVTVPLGWLIDGPAGAAAALGTALLNTCYYEFCHCVQHLAYKPKSRFLQRIKRLHLAHHYRNEEGNFGITNFLWDRVFGTYYEKSTEVPHSPTVRNLGYAGAETTRYPWVRQMTEAQHGMAGVPE